MVCKSQLPFVCQKPKGTNNEKKEIDLENKEYKVIPTPFEANFTDANQFCVLWGGTLVSIGSKAE